MTESKPWKLTCDVCGSQMVADAVKDTFRCPGCGFFSSTLPVTINDGIGIDEARREVALKSLRLANYDQLLRECTDLLRAGSSLLDVGCAHGWFLEAAQSRGIHAYGIEPDRTMADLARAAGHVVTGGFFPAALVGGDRYDAITFNDVLEHIPDLPAFLADLGRFLKPGGLVMVNAPVSEGMIFRLSRLAARIGVSGPLARMWQVGLPSPHLSYFSASTLLRLFNAAGFELTRSGSLNAIDVNGLYQRIRYDRSIGPARAAAFYAVARTVKLVAGLFPSDIQYFVFRATA